MEPDTQALEQSLAAGGFAPEEVAVSNEPTYKVVGESRLPVSKGMGIIWKSRRSQALARRETNNVTKAWDEAIRYYNHDQMGHRAETEGVRAGNRASRDQAFSETENIVFANTTALVPLLYAKNPDVECTAVEANDAQAAKLATAVERLVNTLFQRKSAPGVNLKPKARRAVVMASLANLAYVEVGYTFREQSSEQAMADLEQLSARLSEEKDPNVIAQIEGELQALENSVDLLRPAGPFVVFRRPHSVLRDPDSIEEDLSDANWIIIEDELSTEYVRAKFGKQNPDGSWASIYKPTHVLRAGRVKDEGTAHDQAGDEAIEPFADDKEHAHYGYEDDLSFRRAQRTRVSWVWDKVTRRVYLYNTGDWSWPLWVWDDPYHLDTFFPVFPLTFYTSPEGGEAKGEVTYYLDQQDAINRINSEFHFARESAMRRVVFNKNIVSPSDVEKFIRGEMDRGLGVDLPDGMKLTDVIEAVGLPSLKYAELFNKDNQLQAIDRLSSVRSVQRGAEYKTNTTNRAIESYESGSQTRMDEKIDAIEDFIGSIGWAIAQLCLQHMPQETVASLIGQEAASEWRQMSAQEISATISMSVVGGSATKPTARAKKEEAIQMGQVLGQFANASPAIVVTILRVMERAFDEIAITEEDWRFILESITAQLQRGNSTGGPQQSGPPEQGAQGEQPQQGGPEQLLVAVEQILQQMPPEAVRALGLAISRGVPLREAVMGIIQEMQA